MGTRSLTGGNTMSNKTPFMYAISLGLALTPICFSTVSAQERCKVSEEATAAKSNYTQQHVLDVGDISAHQIRVFELHRTYLNDKPNCEHLKRTESWTRGYSDYIDRNGRNWGTGYGRSKTGTRSMVSTPGQPRPWWRPMARSEAFLPARGDGSGGQASTRECGASVGAKSSSTR